MRPCPIDTLRPARVALPAPRQHIAICASPVLLSDAVASNETGASAVYSDSLTANILYSLQNFWKKAPGFENTGFSIFLTADTGFFRASEFDMVVRLNHFQVKNTYYGEQYTYSDWETYLHVHYAAEWSVRDRSGQLIDSFTDRDLLVWASGIHPRQSAALSELPAIGDAWWDMGIAAARNYADRVSPQWQTGVRYIYMINRFAGLSGQAHSAMLNNGYTRAFSIWEDMLLACRKSGQRKVKSQIAYNMAVASEFQNRTDEAIYWAERSANLSQNSTTLNYLEQLRERQAQSLLLDKQINP